MFLHIGNDKSVLVRDIILIKQPENGKKTMVLVNNGKESSVHYTDISVSTLKNRILQRERV